VTLDANLADAVERAERAESDLRAALSTPEISCKAILDNSTPEPSREPTQEQVDVWVRTGYDEARRQDMIRGIEKDEFERIGDMHSHTLAHAAGFEAGTSDYARLKGEAEMMADVIREQDRIIERSQGAEADCARLVRQRDEFKIWWERDSKALSVALGQRDTARAVAEDNRARYAVAERQRDDLTDALRELLAAESDYNASLDGTTALLRYRWATKQARALLARIDAEKAS
jgi:hypothetical protein